MLDEVADVYSEEGAGRLLNFTINLHPSHGEVGEALVDFLHKVEEWPQLSFIYSHDDSKSCLSQLINPQYFTDFNCII